MDGMNLVVEGPPGTGKSQTISNLIAAALTEGETTLFVSEKLAALEVVRDRLKLAQNHSQCTSDHRSEHDLLPLIRITVGLGLLSFGNLLMYLDLTRPDGLGQRR